MPIKNFTAKMYGVASGNLRKIGWQYDDENKCGVVQVEFNGGANYQYWPVSHDTYSGIFESESKGKYFDEKIKKGEGVMYQNMKLDNFQAKLL